MLYQDLDNLQDLLLQVVDLADEISANISDGLYNEDFIDFYQRQEIDEYVSSVSEEVTVLQSKYHDYSN